MADQPAAGTMCETPSVRAGAILEALGSPMPSTSGGDSGLVRPVMGEAHFAATRNGVDLTLRITGCALVAYPAIIHEGSECTDSALIGAEWDAPRGAGAYAACSGSGLGTAFYSRPSSDMKPWTIGDSTTSDIVDHVLVVHDPNTMQPLACGPIVLQPNQSVVDSGRSDAAPLSADIRAQVAGLCVDRVVATVATGSSDAGCPDPERLAECACMHCELGACLEACSDYVACLQDASDGCAAACPASNACASCKSNMVQCMFGFCGDTVACAPPFTPGGPCTDLETCCSRQGNRENECLAGAHQLEMIGGDVSCNGALHDTVVLTMGILANNPSCFADAN
jgi:hypothetical protein